MKTRSALAGVLLFSCAFVFTATTEADEGDAVAPSAAYASAEARTAFVSSARAAVEAAAPNLPMTADFLNELLTSDVGSKLSKAKRKKAGDVPYAGIQKIWEGTDYCPIICDKLVGVEAVGSTVGAYVTFEYTAKEDIPKGLGDLVAPKKCTASIESQNALGMVGMGPNMKIAEALIGEIQTYCGLE